MKKMFSILVLLMSMNLISAESLSESLLQLDQSLVILIALFIIIFSVSFFSLKNIFKKTPAIGGIISLAFSFLAIYGINKMGINTEEWVLNIGLSTSSLSLLLFTIIVLGITYMFIKLKLKAFLILGGIIFASSFFVYAKNLLIFVGMILIAIWFFITIKKNKTPAPTVPPTKSSP